ncbi:MAG: helix-turn-helix transcriptional regulator, partial [Clostridia bacterium]|nr:helix-turn-helix transcriptional regulator [Clostridia bacterium]
TPQLNQQYVDSLCANAYTIIKGGDSMDQVKIGCFIAECRKAKNLTQMQLAEELNITDRAVSKWENGRSMPDTSVMLDLCHILDISINDLLNGEKISMENNDQKNEQLLLDMAKEVEQKNKTIWTNMWVIMGASITALFAGIFVARFLIPEGIWQLVTILGVCIVFLIPCFYALKLEVSVGAYKCKNCGCEIVPTYKEAKNAMHMGFTRYLKCPNCNKRTWCKKVIKK